ncbi:hypothetical protein A2Y83_01955 [Candidatus Falkowbacteria bacterium RBG_13_39_14]|uniref:Uncharacterized protein n=1 Tax=Candidatus Falkowbacteria bacterium RBG_13_39_14 TaxID=1797985 RepID=A0A1F5S0V2_9BACT|nr:MAG: hypothetical protein A2Y83_01955 [Candidatus Falkowbacteria bacterium RBG_13_39_14]
MMKKIDQIASMLENISDQISALAKELRKEKTSLEKEYSKIREGNNCSLPIEEAIKLITEDIRPEIIPILSIDNNNKIVLLKPQNWSSIAFLLWSIPNGKSISTRYQISLNIRGLATCRFNVICACCFYTICRKNLKEGEEKELRKFEEKIVNEFERNLISACRENHIRTLLVRNPTTYSNDLKNANITMRECYDFIKESRSELTKLSFIDWEESESLLLNDTEARERKY